MTGAAIRPFAPHEGATLRDIVLAAIRQLAPGAYGSEQVAAWAARHEAAERFTARAEAGHLILVACNGADVPLAFAVLEPDGHLDMLYCHPDHAGKGLGLALLAAVEEAARSRGMTRLFTEASELARPVFARAGYALLHRRDFAIDAAGGHAGDDAGRAVPIHNYAMEKRLT